MVRRRHALACLALERYGGAGNDGYAILFHHVRTDDIVAHGQVAGCLHKKVAIGTRLGRADEIVIGIDLDRVAGIGNAGDEQFAAFDLHRFDNDAGLGGGLLGRLVAGGAPLLRPAGWKLPDLPELPAR